jgi:hypothetical protein
MMHMRHSFMMHMRSVAPVAMTGAVGHAVRAYASHHHRLHAPRTCTAHRTAAAAVVLFFFYFSFAAVTVVMAPTATNAATGGG